MRGGAVVEVVGGGGEGCAGGGVTAGAALTGWLQGCWKGMLTGTGYLCHGSSAASSTENKFFILLL